MAPAPTSLPQDPGGYIRGSGGVMPGKARVASIAVLVCLVLLAAVAIALAVSAGGENSRVDTLRRSGVPVQVTVTGCTSIGSGIGMSIEYWSCRGDYTLAGHTFNAVIGGSRAFLESGTAVQAVAVPGRPSLLSTPGVLRRQSDNSSRYIAPAAVGGATVALAGGWAAVRRRNRRQLTAAKHSGQS
jgi:hypothetical protein